MLDVALNDRWDLDYAKADLRLITGVERISQQVKQALLTWWTEWFLDNRIGVPYRESILVKNPNIGMIRGIFTKTIQSVDGVQTVIEMQLHLNARTRILRVDAAVQSVEGPIRLSIPLQINSGAV